MTAEEAYENQLISQLGSACLTIAKQAGAVAELQEQLKSANEKIAQLEQKKPKK